MLLILKHLQKKIKTDTETAPAQQPLSTDFYGIPHWAEKKELLTTASSTQEVRTVPTLFCGTIIATFPQVVKDFLRGIFRNIAQNLGGFMARCLMRRRRKPIYISLSRVDNSKRAGGTFGISRLLYNAP
jgi:hypothetical protein